MSPILSAILTQTDRHSGQWVPRTMPMQHRKAGKSTVCRRENWGNKGNVLRSKVREWLSFTEEVSKLRDKKNELPDLSFKVIRDYRTVCQGGGGKNYFAESRAHDAASSAKSRWCIHSTQLNTLVNTDAWQRKKGRGRLGKKTFLTSLPAPRLYYSVLFTVSN